MAVAIPVDAVVAGGVVGTGIGVAVAVAVGIAGVVGTTGEVAVGAGVSAGFGGGTGVFVWLPSLVADTTARTVAATSGVGATAVGVVGAWVGSAIQAIATRTRMARARKMIARTYEVTVQDTESLRRWV